jgi:hypothetical protein
MADKRDPHEIEKPSRTDEDIKGIADDEEFEDVDESDDEDEDSEDMEDVEDVE